MTNEAIIRNYQFTRNVLAGQDILIKQYKLRGNEVLLIQELCMKLNSFKSYIEFKRGDLTSSIRRKTFYKILKKFENKNIVSFESRPKNNTVSTYKLHFTVEFIKTVCEEEFAKEYTRWLKQVTKKTIPY